MCRSDSKVGLTRKIMSHPGIVQLNVDVKKQAEDDTIDQIQLQQSHQLINKSPTMATVDVDDSSLQTE